MSRSTAKPEDGMTQDELVCVGCGIERRYGMGPNGTCLQCGHKPGQWWPDLGLAQWNFTLQADPNPEFPGYVRLLATHEDGGRTYGSWVHPASDEPAICADQLASWGRCSTLRGLFRGRDTLHYCCDGERTALNIKIGRSR